MFSEPILIKLFLGNYTEKVDILYTDITSHPRSTVTANSLSGKFNLANCKYLVSWGIVRFSY